LTKTQQLALQQAIDAETTVIQGPPGTGKTFLIAAIVRTLLARNSQQRILVTCFSHTAIDNVLREIHRTDPGIPRFRVGRRPEDPDLPPDTNTQLADLPAATVPGVWCMTSFKAGKSWAQALLADYLQSLGNRSEVTDEDRALAVRRAWRTATLPDPGRYFDVVIIDEASQMSLPVALMSLVHGTRCILVGDHRQLPPVTSCKPDFAPSVFDQVLRTDPDGCLMLDVTHRMNEAICASPSRLFYAGRLRPRAEVRDRVVEVPRPRPLGRGEPTWLRRSLAADQPVVLLTVDHDGGGEESPEEAHVVGRIVAELLARGLDHETGLAVVCAHRRQNALVRRETERAVRSRFPDLTIDVTGLISDTVELIQGQERDVIIVSLTSSDPEHLSQQWSFSHCPRRFNVCITRPKCKLIVVASPAFFHFTPAGDSLPSEAISGIAAIKRWYLDRLDSGQVVEVPRPGR
jgi:DNA replication ATP-dependent helicase Dna2